ncbi:glycosyl transferase group 1 [Halorhabdus utahensis DSM 12940]|uniref:Glycosyl transferase group 1 n=1 Tax=Halorhabdus utahensis (strain DSM 12940 / JCM 11049 / AX-2) TaxID=519442 RepID=C7NM95_HALUD|nr:glycosyl transferase group 1 [Halorhabdus utahensis DSM 12940]
MWYLIGTLTVGGAERTLVDLVSRLDDRFDPVIWTIAEPGPLADAVPEDVPVRSLGAQSKADVRAPIRFVRAVRRERPPLLQSFLFFDNTLARLAGLVSPETTVITGVRAVPDSRPRHREWIDRTTLRLSDAIVSNSEAGAEWIISRGASAECVSVIPNGRDVDRYHQPVPDGYSNRLGLPEGPVVGTVGRLIRRKGHHDLIAAWPSIRAHSDDAQLVLVGDGPEYDRLRREVDQLECGDSVHLLGRRDDVPELLALFDVFAFPTYYEGLPGALLEAMCAELPIVTTPVDGCSELVEDGVHGTHVPVGDVEELAEAIIQYVEYSELAGEHAATAHERAVSSFSLEMMVENFQELYDGLMRE